MIPVLFFAFAHLQAPTHPSKPIPPEYKAPAPGKNDIIAIVNGDQIKGKDIAPYLWEWLGPQATQDFINNMILQQACDSAKIKITKNEVERQMDLDIASDAARKKNDPNDPSPKLSVQDVLKNQGYPMSRLFLEARIEVMLKKLTIQSFKPGDWVKVSTIVFPITSISANAVTITAKEATQAVKNLKKGISWISILRSTHPNDYVIQNGGSLGWVNISVFPKPIQQVLLKMKPGQNTDALETKNGFQIFRLDSQGSSASPKDLQELKQRFYNTYVKQLAVTLIKKAQVQKFFPKEAGAEGASSNSKTPKK